MARGSGGRASGRLPDTGAVVPAGVRERSLLAAAVVLLGLLCALVAVGGAAELGPPRLDTLTGPVDRAGVPARGDAVVPEQVRPPPPDGLPGWVLVAVWTLCLVAVLAAVARSVRRAVPSGPPPAEPEAVVDGQGAARQHLGDLRGTARAAAADVRAAVPSDVADAVVLAWERLEAAATELGRPRPAAATPTEFTADLLLGLGADPSATGRLLHLYHRARFSSAPLPAGAEVVAGAALEAVAASLEPAARRGDA